MLFRSPKVEKEDDDGNIIGGYIYNTEQILNTIAINVLKRNEPITKELIDEEIDRRIEFYNIANWQKQIKRVAKLDKYKAQAIQDDIYSVWEALVQDDVRDEIVQSVEQKIALFTYISDDLNEEENNEDDNGDKDFRFDAKSFKIGRAHV